MNRENDFTKKIGQFSANFPNEFKKRWDQLESEKPQPTRLRKVQEMDFEEFTQKAIEQDPKFVQLIVDSLYAGDAYILRNAFSKVFMADLKRNTHELWSKVSQSYHKILEGCPDFHRIIDKTISANYTFKAIKHSYYFFPWNDDPLNIYEEIWRRWRIAKLVGGLHPNSYEKNTPKDGVIDRIQVVRYPPSEGFLETHVDPFQNQRLIFSAYMSRRGVDFDEGGFYVVDENDYRVDFEDKVEIGDMVYLYATVLHGVSHVDTQKPLDWNSDDGRWFLGLYSNSSNEVPNRFEGKSVSIQEKGTLFVK